MSKKGGSKIYLGKHHREDLIGPPELYEERKRRLNRKRWKRFYAEKHPHWTSRTKQADYLPWDKVEKKYRDLKDERLKELEEYRKKPKWEPKRRMA